MTDRNEWHYKIQYGPEGESAYAWLYRHDEMITTLRTHHAIFISEQLNRVSDAKSALESLILFTKPTRSNAAALNAAYVALDKRLTSETQADN